MKRFIEGEDRTQVTLLPECLDDFIAEDNSVRVAASTVDWREAFPQHGAGRKHLRPIELEPWQREITSAFPRELLRGLIHSDGCRTMNRFKTKLPSGRVAAYEYPRYFFSNLSEDIRRIFCEHCELLGIRWTQSNPRNISISHRKSVALMDEFIGNVSREQASTQPWRDEGQEGPHGIVARSAACRSSRGRAPRSLSAARPAPSRWRRAGRPRVMASCRARS